jgi:hypothetical protein
MVGRRELLRSLALGATAVAAGCGAEDGPVTPEPSPEPTASPTRTRQPGPSPAARVLGASATAADGTRVTARRWTTFDRVEYETADGSGTVEPQRGRFLAYDFTITNTGEERLSAVRDSVFRLRFAGRDYRHVHDLRGVAFEAAVAGEGPRIRPLDWYDGLDPGASVRLQLVFDVPHRPRFRHYLAWDHPTAVADVERTVFLWPGAE